MYRENFMDSEKKKGKVGSKVIEQYLDGERGGVLTVKTIMSKGRAGTRLYFEEGGYGKAGNYKVVE